MTEFASPASANGIKWNDVNGSLLMIEVSGTETGIQTAYGEADAIRADITVLDGSGAGGVFADCLVFPKALQGQLRPNIGKRVLGRVMQGVAKSGQSPPWLLGGATEADKAMATAFLNRTVAPAAAQAPF